MKTFRHTNQLVQLRRLDPSAHKAATCALKSGFAKMAAEIIIKAMGAALARLNEPKPVNREYIRRGPGGLEQVRVINGYEIITPVKTVTRRVDKEDGSKLLLIGIEPAGQLCLICDKPATVLDEIGWLCDGCYNGCHEPTALDLEGIAD